MLKAPRKDTGLFVTSLVLALVIQGGLVIPGLGCAMRHTQKAITNAIDPITPPIFKAGHFTYDVTSPWGPTTEILTTVTVSDDGFSIDQGPLAGKWSVRKDQIYHASPNEPDEVAFDLRPGTLFESAFDECSGTYMVFINANVQTAAGEFEDCIDIRLFKTSCSDAGLVSVAFAPDVGLVKVVEASVAGPIHYSLKAYTTTK